jgi:Outer membrane protein beta-barrel domain
MRRFSILLSMVALLALSAAPASALHWSLGANLGMQMVDPDGGDNFTAFAWPNMVTPGLRVGFTGENPQHELYFDTGLSLLSSEDFSGRSFTTTANYQYNFPSQSNLNFFLTGGAGFAIEGSTIDTGPPLGEIEESATSAIYGGGVGIRHKMGNGHGTLRAEVRYDMVGEGEDDGITIIPESSIFGIKLGFDLWD